MTDPRTAVAGGASVRWEGGSADLPTVTGTEAETGLDISNLRETTGLVTFDPGYKNTATAKSAITFLDGEAGILRYRGYPIEQLAARSNFLETAYLLIYGELPSASELEHWVDDILHHTLIHEEMRRFFDSFPYDAHPMAVLASGTVGLSTFYQDSHDPWASERIAASLAELLEERDAVAALAA